MSNDMLLFYNRVCRQYRCGAAIPSWKWPASLLRTWRRFGI